MTYKLTHPDDPTATVDVEAEQVSLYTAQGWQTAPTAPPPAAKKAAAKSGRK